MLAALLIFSSCATKKRRGDVSKLGKFYHSTTSKYNGYFNANVIYEESILKLQDAHRDNYTQVLPIYPETDVADPKIVAEELDRAIEKLSVVISLHRVGEWTDDSYLLFGKSHYMKQDFESAEEAFEYFEDEFDPISVKKKNSKVKTKASSKEKKKERKEKVKSKEKLRKEQLKERKKRIKARKKGKRLPPPKESVKEEAPVSKPSEELVQEVSQPSAPPPAKSGFFVHENVYPDGLLWLARTYIEREKYSLARSTMNKLALFPQTDEVQRAIPQVEAYYFLKQKQYRAALPHLIQGVEMSKDRNERARLAFIAAQIYQMEGSHGDAIRYYSESISSTTDYEMTFHGKLNRLILERITGELTESRFQDDLSKMLKDDKNVEYNGYIHLALATSAERSGNMSDALMHLKEALKGEQIDGIQRAEAYLRIADIYFDEEAYADAKDYYDSTSTFMMASDSRLERVNERVDLLKDIALNIRVIELQDSLMRIGRMSMEEKKQLVAKLKEADLAREAAAQAQAPPAAQGPSINKRFPNANEQAFAVGGTGGLSSNFFAYDPRILKKGQREFEKNWGDRKLEDNWRRSNKRSVSFFEQQPAEDEQDQEVALSKEVTVADVNRYLSGVPTNQKEVAAAEKKIVDAYFELGRLYRDKMLNNQKAVETLETLLERYPESPHTFDAWFLLYLAHKELGNKTDSDKYAALILERNPDSKYAQVIRDPDYAARMLSKEQQLVAYYDETFSLFQNGAYQQAFDRIENSSSMFGQDHELVPRFALLKSMCLGKLESKESYITGLKEVVAKYPEAPEAFRAKEILRFLQGDEEAFTQISEDVLQETNFKMEDASLHYVIAVIFDLGDRTLDEAKIAAANYNRDNYRNYKFRVAHNMLSIEPQTPLILIRKFDSRSEAFDYASKIEDKPESFMPKGVNFEVYAITQQNYREVMKQRSVNEYRLFYAKNYR